MDDFDGIRTWVNNKQVTTGLMDSEIFEHEHSIEETMAFLQGSLDIDSTNIRLVIADKISDQYLGQIALFNFSTDPATCQLDIVIADPNRYDQGIGTEVSLLASDLAFIQLKQLHVIAHVKTSNPRAIRCAEKSGFHLLERNDEYFVYFKSGILEEECHPYRG